MEDITELSDTNISSVFNYNSLPLTKFMGQDLSKKQSSNFKVYVKMPGSAPGNTV